MSKTITRADLSESVAQRAGLSKAEATRLTDRMFEIIGETLMQGETVKLTGFGSLQVRARAERIGRNPRTGKEHTISPRNTVVLTPGQHLRQTLDDLKR